MMMMRILVLLLFFSANAALAQLTKLTEEDFKANTVRLEASLASGADASSGLSRYGVFLSSYPSGTPVVRDWTSALGPLHSLVHPLVTNETTGDQAESVLVIDFRFSVKKVGLTLVGANPPLSISIKAADRASDTIGTLKEIVGGQRTFVGFQASDNRPISKVILDYGSSITPEQLLELRVEPLTPPRFETVLPQIAHGRLGLDAVLSTTISIVNVSNTSAKGEIRFYAPDGKPLTVDLAAPARGGDVVRFTVHPWLPLRSFTTSGKAGLAGYARVVSSAPIQAIAHFHVAKSNGERSERSETAAVSVDGRFGAIGAYSLGVPAAGVIAPVAPSAEPPEGSTVGCALAIVNLAAEPASVRLILNDDLSFTWTEDLVLAPGEQFARFVDEIFDEPPFFKQPVPARAAVQIFSDRPMAAILIKTVNGLPVSILPLASLED